MSWRKATLTLFLVTIATSTSLKARDGDCAEGSAGNIICEILVGTEEESASDLGLYNITVVLKRLPGDSGEEFKFKVSIDAGKCDDASKHFIDEAVRFRKDETNKRFNFPLLLHPGEAQSNRCVVATASECEGGCVARIEMLAGETAVMRSLEPPPPER